MDTRTALLDCAETACRNRGYDGFSYADLSRTVGIRKASIHHHFPTKADLALAVIERYSETFFAALDDIENKNQTAAAQLRAYHQIYRDALVGGEQLCLCAAFSAGRDSLAPPVLERLNRFNKKSVTWLTAVFERAAKDDTVDRLASPDAEARACLALMVGAQLVARAAVNDALFDQATQAFLDRLMAGRN